MSELLASYGWIRPWGHGTILIERDGGRLAISGLPALLEPVEASWLLRRLQEAL